MGPPISPETEKRIALLFAPEDRDLVRAIQQNECGANLPSLSGLEISEIERIRFAVLKISRGKMDRLEKAVQLAKIDWRDALASAGFAWNPTKHHSWLPGSRS